VQLLYGRRVLLQDPGTLEYVGDGSDRNALRGTTAHNTMTVDGYGQSDPTGPFAWSRLTRSHPEIWVAAEYFDLFCGSHDGYAERGISHRRWVFHLPGRFWLIRDVAEGSGVHNLELAWHLGPDPALLRAWQYLHGFLTVFGGDLLAPEKTECLVSLHASAPPHSTFASATSEHSR